MLVPADEAASDARCARPDYCPRFNGAGSVGGRTTGGKASAKTGLRERGLAVVDTVLAFHSADAADAGDWQREAAHPTPAGPLIPGAVVLLATGRCAFVELDRGTMSNAHLSAKVDRYAAYRTAPPSGRGNAAPAPSNHWQEHYAGHDLERAFPQLLVVFARAAPRRRPGRRSSWPRPPVRNRSGAFSPHALLARVVLLFQRLLGVWPGLPGRPDVVHCARDRPTKLQPVAGGFGVTTAPWRLPPVLPLG
ncbi:replication-relaxation family protein [Actinacidiphila sp. DG2A-62]|uniref:replication-relaxation family protein n=1 Tax=Actinacidiphila sp. DG2A-62 TaxID=3108821 RepID=UPI002DBBA7A3|nr:replication-relaxation family protein [Actinacidiphila sp. DG2A-62]MEC3997035.1 replication-relaxation family protein [Actinacidiphila sp. DG2A-62]